jgi:hypothetical protein
VRASAHSSLIRASSAVSGVAAKDVVAEAVRSPVPRARARGLDAGSRLAHSLLPRSRSAISA